MDLPRVPGQPVMGMFSYMWERNTDLSELHVEVGPSFAINLGLPLGGWHLATSDPAAVRDILDCNDDRFYAAWPDPVLRLIGPRERLFTDAEAKPWRRMLSNAISPEVVMSLQLPLMVEDLGAQIRAISASGGPVMWHKEARRIAFGVATRATMGSLVSDDEMDELCAMFDNIGVTSALDFGFKDGIPGTPFWRSVQSRKAIEEVLYAKIKPAIDDPQAFGGQRCAVLRMFNGFLEEQAAGGGAESLSNAEIAKMLTQDAYFLMFAGTDTTSYSIMQCALALDRYPEWFQKLKDEQDALRAEFGDAIDRKVLSRSSVATALALEILRLKAPVPAVFRRAAQDTTVAGISIPKGGRVIVNLRQPTASTGTGSPKFNPAQWLKADGSAAKANDSRDNLAFGAGPRRCVGQSLATVEIITALAIMGREVATLEIPAEEHDINFGASPIHPTGMPIKFTARSSAEAGAAA